MKKVFKFIVSATIEFHENNLSEQRADYIYNEIKMYY